MDLDSRMCYLAFLVTAAFGLEEFFYTLTNTSWEEANRTCTLATPRIVYSRQGFTLDFGEEFEVAVGQHWVGYTTHNFIFQYIGCSLEEDVAGLSIRNYTLPSPRPGVCYSACDTDVFGMKDEQCYCFENRPHVNIDKQACTHSCKQRGIKCGEKSAVSIFEVADLTMINVTRTPQDTEYCIAYDLGYKSFRWEDCESLFRAQRCQISSGHQLMNIGEGKIWSESADDCFSRYTNSKLYDDDVDNKDPYWTGYFRTDAFIRTFKDHGTPVFYGLVYMQDKKRQPQLRFRRDKKQLNALCVAKPPSAIFTSALESTASTPGKQASTMLTTALESIASTPGKQALPKFNATDIESTASTPENDLAYLPIKIGVPLLISACVAVVVTGVICYRRSRQTGTQMQQQTQQQTTRDSTYFTPTEAGMDESHNYTELNIQSETPDYMNV